LYEFFSSNTNTYAIDLNKRTLVAMDSANILQDGDYENIRFEENVGEEENEEIMIPTKHESPILFLNSPNHTIKDKIAYVDYFYGMQLSYAYENSCCNRNVNNYVNSCTSNGYIV
jgi:hypothetical protein